MTRGRESHVAAPDVEWPRGTPWTVYFPHDGGYLGADLEYAAPLPRVGDTVEYFDETGTCRRYRVTEVVHTLQSSAATRPRVRESEGSPTSLVRDGSEGRPEPPGAVSIIRSGLPKVILEELQSPE